MKKNIFTLFMAAVMCLSMAACGAKKEEAPVAPPAPAISEPAASVEGPAADPGVGVPAEPTEGPVADVMPEVPAEPETPAVNEPGSNGPSKPVEPTPAPEQNPVQPAPEQGPEAASVDLSAFHLSLLDTYGENFPAVMNLCEMVEMLDGFYPGLSGLETKQMMVYQPMMNAVVCEIVLVEVVNAADVETVKSICQERIDAQVNGGAWYPESIEGWKNNSRIVVNGNCVMMIAYSECDAVVEAFNGLFA